MYPKASQRQDLFKFIRWIMYSADMHSFHLERYMPASLRSLGILLELLIEFFLYFVTIHILILYICTIYVNFETIDLDLFVNCLIQAIIYWWAITVKLYFRRWHHKLLQNLIDFLNLKYKTQSEIALEVHKTNISKTYDNNLYHFKIEAQFGQIRSSENLYPHFKKSKKSVQILRKLPLFPILHQGFTYVTMDNCFQMSNKWVRLYVKCCFLGTIFWLLLPFAYGDRSLPLNCWYPFNYKQPIVYEAMYFLQFVGQIQVAAAFSASSGFHMVLCILISGQYDILYCSLKNILATVALNSKTTQNDLRKLYIQQLLAAPGINEYYCSKEISYKMDTLLYRRRNPKCRDFRLQFRKAIKKCVNHHRYILKCLNKMEDFYSPIWFFKTAEIISLMCLVAFVAVKSTSAHSSIIEVISLVQYMFLIVWELFIICYFAETIFVNSQRCGDAILRSPWYLHMCEMKYDFLLFLLNSLRPFKLTAGKILTLDNELFKNMLSTGFSFLTLLQKMDQRNK